MKFWNDLKIVEDEAERVKKMVFYSDGAVAEAVLYRYPDYETRTVICCSTQSGCPVGCRFCGAGNAFIRNLTSDEIVEQVDEAIKLTGIDSSEINRLQIMFMSMGEPLLNFKNLSKSLVILNEKYPNASLLISTSAPDVGGEVWDKLYNLSELIPNIGLQFSIHESTDEKRNELIPFKKKLSLQQISLEGKAFYIITGRKAFFNYCAHENNSTIEDAQRLRSLFNPKYFNATVSVICEVNDGMPSANDFQRSLATEFASKLVDLGFDVRVFDPAGQDTIGGGCGQLWFVQKYFEDNPDIAKKTVGHGLPVRHAPTME